MKTVRVLAAFPLVGALLAGCAPSVTVKHPLAPARMKATDVPKLARIAAVMTPDERSAALASATVGGAAMGQILSALTAGEDRGEAELSVSPSQSHEALSLTAYKLESPYSHVIAHMAKGPSTDSFLSIIAPSAVLWLEPSVVKASRQEGVTESKDRRTGEVTRTTVFVHTANWTVKWRLVSWPDGAEMASGSEGGQSTERTDQPVDLAEWLPDQAGPLAGWTDSVRAQILPRIAYRSRRIWREKKVRVDQTGSLAAWNAGVAAEQQGAWEEAKAKYRTALAGIKKSGDRNRLSGYLNELESVSESRPAGSLGDEGWFAAPVAVAPFENDTNNVGAPEVVRAMVQEELVRRGYAPLPLAEADRRFHAAGISQGEHLKAVSPAKVAAATGTKRILTGKVDEFKILNVGVYYRRQARVTLSMRDETGRVLWQAPGVSVRQVLARPQDAGKVLLAGLIGATLEKMTKTYLKEDVGFAVKESLPYLPARDRVQPQVVRRQQRKPATAQRQSTQPASGTEPSAPKTEPSANQNSTAPVLQPASVPATQPAPVSPPVAQPASVPATQPAPVPLTPVQPVTPPVMQPASVPGAPKTEPVAPKTEPVTPKTEPAVQPTVESEKPGKALGLEKQAEGEKPGKALGQEEEKPGKALGQEKKDEELKPGKADGHQDEKPDKLDKEEKATVKEDKAEKQDEGLKPGKAVGHEDEKPAKLDKEEKAAAKEDKAEKQEEKKAKENAPEKPATPAEKSPVPETKSVPGNPPEAKKAEPVKEEKAKADEKPAKEEKADKADNSEKDKGKDDKTVKDNSSEKPDTPAASKTEPKVDKSPVPETKQVPDKKDKK